MPLIPQKLRRNRSRAGQMTLVEHLEELRRRLFIALAAIGVGSIVGWFLYNPVIRLVLEPYCTYVHTLPKNLQPLNGCRLAFFGPLESFIIKLKVVVFLGLAVALPIILYQLWAFIVPGLTKRERRMSIPFIFSSVLLFALGAFVAWITLPKGLQFLLGFAGPSFAPVLSGDRFLTFVMLLAAAFGLSFEFPIVLIFLSLAGVVSSRKLRDWRRGAYVFIALFAAIITPSSDPYTMTAMMVPMMIFYEVAIIVTRAMHR